MQLNDKNLYAAGLSLIEQNLHNLDEMGALTLQVMIEYDKLFCYEVTACIAYG